MRVRMLHRVALAGLLAALGCDTPGTTLAHFGVSGSAEANLGVYLLAVSIIVVLVILGLLLVAAVRARGNRHEPGELLVATGGGLSWIMIGGIVVPSIILTVTFILTLVTLNAVAAPSRPMANTIRVTGHMWWWEIRYLGSSPDSGAVTANELHIPVGEPVRLELQSSDVIHSFWVPELAGKTDIIPGQTNVAWLEAKKPGVYWGRCGEYCGMQHANMELRVVAESPAQFHAWLAAQRKPAADPGSPAASAGKQVFLTSACASCHTVRGTPAGGSVGPDLTHLASRLTIAGGMLANTRGNLAGWIADAQGIKPGVQMPTMAPKPGQLEELVSYLQTLH